MSPSFTSSSPLTQAVLTILRQQSEGLTIPELRRALIKAGRPGAQEQDLEQIARLPEFHRLPGGKITLREMEPPVIAEPEENVPPEFPYSEYPSTLRDLPSLQSYVIFDLETNGLSPSNADFFQLSAIKVVNGQPEGPFFDAYAQIETKSITRALRDKLHFDELGLEEKITRAGTQVEAIEAFRKFSGDLPLVAHNGTFDIGFLHKHIPDLPNPLIDLLELVCLAFPAEPSHRVEALGKMFGLTVDGMKWGIVAEVDHNLGIQPGWG